MITGILKSEKCPPGSKQVFWTIEKLNKKLEEGDILQSVSFPFAGQKWRVLLITVDIDEASHIEFSLSRITVSNDGTSLSQFVCWNVGILDRNETSHYVRSGFVGLELACADWISVADWSGPELTHLCMENNLYMPQDKFTVSIHLRLDSGCALTSDEQDLTKKESIPEYRGTIFDDVLISVKNITFHVQKSSLEKFSEVMSVQNFRSKWDGENNVMDFPDCDPKAFELFLSFAYSGELPTEELTGDITEKLYDIANKFDFPKLKEECVRRFLSTLDVSSASGILDVAERHRDEELKEKAAEFFLDNIRGVVQTSKWLELMAKQTKLANDLILRYFEKTN